MSESETNITGDIHGNVYTGHIGDKIVNHNYYGPAAQGRIPDQSPPRVPHFVGRDQQIELFRQNLALRLDDGLRRFI